MRTCVVPQLSKAEELKLYDQSAQEIGRKQSEIGRQELIEHQKSKSKEQKDLEEEFYKFIP